MKLRTPLILLTLVCASQGVLAKGDHHHSFADIDGDDDGRISLEEFLQRPQERFARIDANQDGYIQAEEMAAMREKRRERREHRE